MVRPHCDPLRNAMRNPSTTIARTLSGLGLGLKANLPPTRKATETDAELELKFQTRLYQSR
jgi:hypothetical protein